MERRERLAARDRITKNSSVGASARVGQRAVAGDPHEADVEAVAAATSRAMRFRGTAFAPKVQQPIGLAESCLLAACLRPPGMGTCVRVMR